jgi:hypothetical protein
MTSVGDNKDLYLSKACFSLNVLAFQKNIKAPKQSSSAPPLHVQDSHNCPLNFCKRCPHSAMLLFHPFSHCHQKLIFIPRTLCLSSPTWSIWLSSSFPKSSLFVSAQNSLFPGASYTWFNSKLLEDTCVLRVSSILL